MICVACRKFLRPKKNGVLIEEMSPQGETWAPYQLWHADLWECPGCRVQVVGGFGFEPVSEHYHPEYARVREAFGPVFLVVEDCGSRHAGPRPQKKPERA